MGSIGPTSTLTMPRLDAQLKEACNDNTSTLNIAFPIPTPTRQMVKLYRTAIVSK